MDDEAPGYSATDASGLVGEVFGGNLPIAEAIEKLRTRLLDLTSSNRLLKYRHPKGRCIQIIGTPNLNQVFSQLTDGKQLRLLPVPDPLPSEFEGNKKPDVRTQAERMGISTSVEFPPSPQGPHNGRRLAGLQIAQYPADLDRLARKVANEAKTAIEETGSNMLFLMFGFLEFYDTDDSDKPFLAPILCLPASFIKGAIDPESRSYQWLVQHNGEDLAENATLKEKLKQFALQLPDLEEHEEEPESLFRRIEQSIKSRRRWRVVRQLTIGMLSFGKLAVWADLDPRKHPGILTHPLTTTIFKGGESGGDTQFYAEDYRIDERSDADVPLVYDADSSQHSAVIDVLSGKNVVINGPPGTGKSQTITNIIAAAITQGKKVLFVSEKLAALEVVRHRLNKANLGHFCLELHSHKTQKKKFIEEISDRIQQRFPAPTQFSARLETLKRLKSDLGQHAALMGSKVANNFGLTINEVFWACERRRAVLGDLASHANGISLPQAGLWSADEVQARRHQIEGLADLWIEVVRAGEPHPWKGFRPRPFVPGDDVVATKTVMSAKIHFELLASKLAEFTHSLQSTQQWSIRDILETTDSLLAIPDFRRNAIPTLLPKLFDTVDPRGERSEQAVCYLHHRLGEARELYDSAYRILIDGWQPDQNTINDICQNANAILLPSCIAASIEQFKALTLDATEKLARLEVIASGASPIAADVTPVARAELNDKLASTASVDLGPLTLEDANFAASAVGGVARKLERSLQVVQQIAATWSLPFEDDPVSIERLLTSSAVYGLVAETPPITADEIEAATRLVESPFVPASAPLRAIAAMAERVQALKLQVVEALNRSLAIGTLLGLQFEGPASPEQELAALASMSRSAPLDLLRYRSGSLADRSTGQIINTIKAAIERDTTVRVELENTFHLDAVPSATELKQALSAFRRGRGFLAILNGEWRQAMRLYRSIAKERRKRNDVELAEAFSLLLGWIDHQNNLEGDKALAEALPGLFRGVRTEIAKVEQLHGWLIESYALLGSADLHHRVDLVSLDTTTIETLAFRAEAMDSDLVVLRDCEAALHDILGYCPSGFSAARRSGWQDVIAFLERVRETLTLTVRLLGRRGLDELPALRIIQLMQAKYEIESHQTEIAALARGVDELRAAGGRAYERSFSNEPAHWSQTIGEVSDLSTDCEALVRIVGRFVPNTTTVSAAIEFIDAKLAMDRSLERLTTAHRSTHWGDYIERSQEVVHLSHALLEQLEPNVPPSKSLDETFRAVASLGAHERILTALQADTALQELLGPALKGRQTDDEAILATHRWGKAVVAALRPSDLTTALLSAAASDVLGSARLLLGEMAEAYSNGNRTLEELASLGCFSLTAWHSHSDSVAAILAKVEAALCSADTVMPLSRWHAAEDECRGSGLSEFAILLTKGGVPPLAMGQLFEFSVYQSIARSICETLPQVPKFDGRSHSKLRSEFMAADREFIALTGQKCAWQIDTQKTIPWGSRGTHVSDLTETQLLRHEIGRQRGHIPIRQLVKRAGRTLQALKPCFMMGPLSVAQYLEPGAVHFDLLVMDEASQLRPEDAIGAVARCSQLVVVGDPKQLPPTNFFDASADDDDEDDGVAIAQGVESILDIAQQIFAPMRSLRWHYRSQHESLIAFSNFHFYKNLVVFPSPHGNDPGLGVKWRYVDDGVYEERRNVPEAQRVADAVVWHMMNYRYESLGVATLNSTQRDLVEELLENRFRKNEECQIFMERWEEEGWPFFVKNLENVQGDERDCILISTTFGKPRGSSRVRQNFGPISRPVGWRRLNVLFTRAKRRVELFSSMQPEDIVTGEKTPEGTRALRDYLDYAKRGVLTTIEESEREPDSDFEVAVANVLRGNGYEVRPQLGVAGYFVDLAVRNPDWPGEWLAAIECDGATYHSGLSVRDRDRIRQEILEALGWKGRIHRIWSTDWYYRPLEETRRLLDFLAARRASSAQEQRFRPVRHPAADQNGTSPAEAAMEEADQKVVEELSEPTHDGHTDLFVELGDRVTYCFSDSPSVKLTVHIVDGPSNPRFNIVNDQTPLAQALLGMSLGEEDTFNAPGQKGRIVKVVKIDRHGHSAT